MIDEREREREGGGGENESIIETHAHGPNTLAGNENIDAAGLPSCRVRP